MKKALRFLLFQATIVFLGISSTIPAQAQNNDTFTINTYYPSPRGIYKTLEAKTAFAVGEVHNDPKVATMENLAQGQLYVGDSVILKSQASDPANGKPGQVIYNGFDKAVKYYNGTNWINMTACSCPICGASNAKAFTVKPTTDLCASGTLVSPPGVTGTGPWNWKCASADGLTIASCIANKKINGACGIAATSSPYASSATGFAGPLCASGTASPVVVSFPLPGNSVSWTCLGINGGTNTGCSATHTAAAGPTPHTAAECFAAGGIDWSTTPSNLCRFCTCTSHFTCPAGWSGDGNNYVWGPCDSVCGPGGGMMTYCY